MILPTKHIPESRSLIGVGGTVLALLSERETTVSGLWELFRETRCDTGQVSFDWFVLGLDLLYAMGALEFDRGVVRRRKPA